MTSWPKICLAIFILTIFWATPNLGAQEFVMPKGLNAFTYEAALKDATTNKKTILLYFWADWCPSCRHFNNNILPDKNVLKTLNKSYCVVSINTAKDPDGLAKKFQVNAIPAFIFLDAQGEPLTMLPGAVEADIFVLVLDYVSSGSFATMDFEEYAKLKTK
ncbi:MAG: thioredoxin fold domain-containing protein [Deltaproteobacteria bacterium]|nr:thioredoxin fold domain-containing protein [Deltaproteobacteria bacterium]